MKQLSQVNTKVRQDASKEMVAATAMSKRNTAQLKALLTSPVREF